MEEHEQRRRTGKGQAAVEFALVLTVLLLLVYGIIEVSRLIFINAEIDNAAREGARYAALDPSVVSDTLKNEVQSRLVMVDGGAVTVVGPTYLDNGGQRCSFCRVQVTVRYEWSTLVPIVNLGAVTLQSTATSLIETP